MELTVKQETFCAIFVEKGNASEAYRLSYNCAKMKPSTVWRKAAELLENGKVTARIEQLQEEARMRHEVTLDSVLDELESARVKALEAGQCAAAVSATMGKAKLLGMLTDKVHCTTEMDVQSMTTEEIKAEIAKIQERRARAAAVLPPG